VLDRPRRAAHGQPRVPQPVLQALGNGGHVGRQVIAGREEARLIYLGVAHSLSDPLRLNRRLVIDIGGGSTEFIVGQGMDSLRRESLFMGCVSMSRAFLQDKITAKAMQQAEIEARLELQPIVAGLRAINWDQVIGASGTIRAVHKVVLAQQWSEQGITLESLEKVRTAVLEAGRVERLELEGLSAQRKPVFAGGVAVLSGIFQELGITHMEVSDQALREGVLYDLLGRFHHEDVRERTIKRFQLRYSVDTQQAARVENTAFDFLRQVRSRWQLTQEEFWYMLSWAAQLHEIGLAVAHSQYHKHGAYLLENSDMAGFSTREQSLLAELVRAHRRKVPVNVLDELFAHDADEAKLIAIRLTVLLRLSVLLHRSRAPDVLPPIQLHANGNKLSIKFPADWLNRHPLTLTDLKNEQEYLQVADIQLQFE
ncbi:MAG: Ppx/GppA phosphatase family protein, partial [Pseudomonadota bacterium]